MMNENSAQIRNTSAFLVLVSLTAMLNALQTMVLCVGHDGHVAVEVAGHNHCRGEHASDSHCCPCTDIPIPIGLCTEHKAANEVVPGSTHPAAPLSLPQAPKAGVESVLASASALLVTSYYIPLRSVVLQV